MSVTLVTGATGFVGGRLVKALVNRGESVRVLIRDPARLQLDPTIQEALEIRVGDILDRTAVEAAVKGASRVYHCAAFVGLGVGAGAGRLNQVNVGGTAIVVDEALEAGVTRLVHTSSIAALGRPENTTSCLDESTEWSESPLNTPYARSKYLAELEVQRAVAEGLDAVLVNPALIMGPGRPGENTMKIAEAVYGRKLAAMPRGGTNVVDVDDVVNGHLRAMDRGRTGERYVLAGENLSWAQIIRTLAYVLDVRPPKRMLNPKLAYALGGILEAVSFFSRGTPVITRETARLTAHTSCYDNLRAREELGLEFRSFEETARDIARHLRG